MIIADDRGFTASHGTSLARKLAEQYGKPLLVADLHGPDVLQGAEVWLRAQCEAFGSSLRLAIGGPRESEAPGIYQRAAAFLGTLLAAAP